MNEFRRQFIEESLGKLAVLHERISDIADAAAFREAFRLAHSIKGGAQIFGMAKTANFAAELEDRLAAENPDPRMVKRGIAGLRKSFETPDIAAGPTDAPLKKRPKADSTMVFTSLPAAIADDLSAHELAKLVGALKAGKIVGTVEARFAEASFSTEYPRLRKEIEDFAQVIAAMPANVAGTGLTFRFVVAGSASDLRPGRLSAAVTPYAAMIVPELAEILGHIIRHIAEAADESARSIAVTIVAHPLRLPHAVIGELFEILLHLTRNASEHAFEKFGRIDIRLFLTEDRVRLTVTDDGRGIEHDKVRNRAVERGLIAAGDLFSPESVFGLIFESGFSTAERVSDYAGRGVGLDSVRAAVERLAGQITVASRPGRTTFTVSFPNPKR